jgi:hypothetical protein
MRARDGITSNVAVGETFGMSASKRTIGVSTGGGDCPGLNAVIRAVVRTARLEYGWRVIGVTNGFNGLIWPEQSEELTTESIRGFFLAAERFLGRQTAATRLPIPLKKTAGKSFTIILGVASRVSRGSGLMALS